MPLPINFKVPAKPENPKETDFVIKPKNDFVVVPSIEFLSHRDPSRAPSIALKGDFTADIAIFLGSVKPLIKRSRLISIANLSDASFLTAAVLRISFVSASSSLLRRKLSVESAAMSFKNVTTSPALAIFYPFRASNCCCFCRSSSSFKWFTNKVA